MLEKHQQAPQFSAKNQSNETVSLSDYLGQKECGFVFLSQG